MNLQLGYILFCLLLCCSLNTGANQTHANEKTEETPKPAIQKSEESYSVVFEFFSENSADEKLQHILEDTKTFSRIKNLIESNFILSAPLRVHIQHQQAAKLVTMQLGEKSNVITLPFGFLNTLYQGITQKYEHQISVINLMFSASTEFFIWSELADYLINYHQLEIIGPRYTAKDNLASLMMLNQNNANSDFLADASEAYLLIHTSQSQQGQVFQNELLQDQQRYRHIVCLVMGFEKRIQLRESEAIHLAGFSLSENDIAQCESNYQSILENWFQAMQPFLRKQNLIHHWLRN